MPHVYFGIHARFVVQGLEMDCDRILAVLHGRPHILFRVIGQEIGRNFRNRQFNIFGPYVVECVCALEITFNNVKHSGIPRHRLKKEGEILFPCNGIRSGVFSQFKTVTACYHIVLAIGLNIGSFSKSKTSH